MNWTDLTIISQVLFTVWFALTHWVPLNPLNDLSQEAFPKEQQINCILHIFQIASIIGFLFHFYWLIWLGIVFWSVSFVGHILSWWLPYFFGWPKGFLENAEADNAKTYHFLPPRKNHPIPDLNHCVIGLLLLATLITCWMTVV